MSDERAISTVMDVALALLLVSASVLLVGIYLANDGEVHDPERGHQAAELLSEATISVQYDVSAVQGLDGFTEPEGTPDEAYTRTEYGPATGLLADAAVTGMEIDGEQATVYADEFETAVDASSRSAMVGSDLQFYAVATWEPYENASAVAGRATAGERSPPDEDVSSVTFTVSSGFDSVDDEAVAEAYRDAEQAGDDGFEAAGAVVAEEIVDGLFPPGASQHSLETLGFHRSMKTAHYVAVGDAVGADVEPDDEAFNRTDADAPALNDRIADDLAGIVADDLEDDPELAAEIEAIEDQSHGSQLQEYHEIGLAIADRTSIDDVTVTVHSWDP